MTCDDIRDLIEPWAAGEASPSIDATAHVRECVSCQDALAIATEIEEMLASAKPASIPPHFTDRVVRAARREQSIGSGFGDVIFTAVTSGALVIAGVVVWISLAGGAVDAASLPLEAISLTAAATWLAWLWSRDETLTQR